MFALFDMSVPKLVRVVLFAHGDVLREETKEGSNVELLGVLDDALQHIGKTPRDIVGIAAVVGAGTFTSTRLAVTVANTFAYVHQIPVVGVTDTADMSAIAAKIEAATPGQFISATYSGMPRIGKK